MIHAASIKRTLSFALCSTLLITPNFSHAGDMEVGAAKGVMIAGILNEKCTGQKPRPNETQRQFQALLDQGFSEADIKRGFLEGMIYAEGNYPGTKKPPRSECREAIKMHKQALQLIR